MVESINRKPILCRGLQLKTFIAIDSFVAAGIFQSRSQALAELANEGLQARLQRLPELQEIVEIYKQMHALAKCETDELPT